MNFVHPPNKQHYDEQVWAIARQIPFGKVFPYGKIAKLIPQPTEVSDEDYRLSASRWVGLAMAACPSDVPWHRVVNAQGKISKRSDPGKQKMLLEAEGVLLVEDKINLDEFLWAGPGQSEAPEQGRLF